MSKSLEHLDLFREDSDRELFRTLLDQKMSKYDCHCYAYTLMRNHYHLILRPSASNISKLMQSINYIYTVYYNGKYNRKGYLFFDRFKSISTGSLDYLKNLIDYTHANPLRAGFVEYISSIKNFQWTSFQYLSGKKCPYKWLKLDFMQQIMSNYSKHQESVVSFKRSKNFNAWKHDETLKRALPKSPKGACSKESSWIGKCMKRNE